MLVKAPFSVNHNQRTNTKPLAVSVMQGTNTGSRAGLNLLGPSCGLPLPLPLNEAVLALLQAGYSSRRGQNALLKGPGFLSPS